MTRRFRAKSFATAAAAILATNAALVAAPRVAHAVPACTSFTNPLVVESGDTQENLLKYLGAELTKSATPMTVVYNLTGSCTLTSDVYLATKVTVNMEYVPNTTNANDPAYVAGWDPTMPSPLCTVDPAGQPIDLGISALFIESCNLGAPPAGLIQIHGPIQGYAFVTDTQSSQQAIVAQEAYFVFGFGQAGMVTPWTDETQMFIRPSTKSTLVSIADNIRVPPAKWHGIPESSSELVVTAVSTSTATNRDSVIGILGTEVYDADRNDLKLLAYQTYQQAHAYFPDSSFTSHDKRSLRDGHYTLWSPTVYLGASTDGATFTNTNAERFVSLVLGDEMDADVDGLAQVITVGLTPSCAMGVQRSTDGGDLSLFTPAAPCGCYFESAVPGGSTACTPCTSDGPCGGGHCRYGFCEAN